MNIRRLFKHHLYINHSVPSRKDMITAHRGEWLTHLPSEVLVVWKKFHFCSNVSSSKPRSTLLLTAHEWEKISFFHQDAAADVEGKDQCEGEWWAGRYYTPRKGRTWAGMKSRRSSTTKEKTKWPWGKRVEYTRAIGCFSLTISLDQ